MTLVHFHLADAEGRGLDGSVSLVPTRRVTVADAIRLPVAQTVKLTAGEATAEVMPSTTQWAWRASELVAGGIVRYVEVPDKESAEYSGLADVDPKTLDQSSETVAAWELVTRAAQGVFDRIGTIDDKIQSAAASADAAKASETVASQESAKAAAAASKAQSSQSEAAKSAQVAHESEIMANGLIGKAKTIAGQLTETAGQVKQDAATASQAAETATVKAAAAATAQDRAETARQAAETAMKTAQAKADAAGVSADKAQASGLLHRADRAILTSRRVTADETQKSSDGADQAYLQWFRGADGRIDLYRHGGRSAAFASMGQYYKQNADDRYVFRDTHGHVVRRYRDEREGDHRGWLGHHARNDWMVVGRHIARQGRARDHTVHRMFQRRGLAGHASFGRRLLRQGHGGILALTLSLGVAA